jgi:type III secretion system YscQ/HrcQ family protein
MPPPRVRPLPALPRVSRGDLAAARQTLRASPFSRLDGPGGEGLSFRWRRAEPPDPEEGVAVLLSSAAGRAGLVLDEAPVQAAVATALGAPVDPLTGPPSEGERGVFAHLLARRLAGSGWRVRAVFVGPAPLRELLGDDAVHRFAGELTVRGVVGPCALRHGTLSPAGLVRPPPLPAAAGWPVDVHLVGEPLRLDLGTLRSLRPGDAVLPDAAGLGLDEAGPAGPCWLRVGPSGRAPCHLRGRRLKLLGPVTANDSDAPDAAPASPFLAPAPGADDPDGLAASLPMSVEVRLGTLRMTVGELSGLVPGAVLTTGRAVGAEVSLRVGDREVAAAELVDVDGELGVRVLRTFLRQD